MQEIHAASLDVLENTGTVVLHEEAVEFLKQAGARIENGNRVYMPEKLIEDTIEKAPQGITIYNRRGEPAMQLEGCHVYYGTGSDCPNLLDTFSGERRPFLYKSDINS